MQRREPQGTIGALTFDDAVVACGRPGGFPERVTLASHPMLAALRRAGSRHVYGDTASTRELGELLAHGPGGLVQEIDGNTANQPLVAKVLDEALAAGDLRAWADALRRQRPELSDETLLPYLYAIVCGRLGTDFLRAFASHRVWEVSLQIHMGLVHDPQTAHRIGHHLRDIVSSAFVKVPFAPHAPETFLVARDLEADGVPVNFTSTFSARQAVAAALLADVARTNVFMGRLNQGLGAELLGEHVCLEAQRGIRRAREEQGAKTQLIVASMREWRSFVETAGCDTYTAPCAAIRDFLTQDEVPPEAIESRVEHSYEDRMRVGDEARKALGDERVARLWRVEPELLEFLHAYRTSEDWKRCRDGAELVRRFEEAGFGDVFHAPSDPEWKEIRATKVPDLGAEVTGRVALDTLYSLMADADFEKYQDEMDERLRAGLRKA